MSKSSAVRVLLRDIVINSFIASKFFPRGLRWSALRAIGMRIDPCSINADCFFGGTNVRIGKGTFINYGVFIDNAARVDIGERCAFGPRVTLLTGTHSIGIEGRRAGSLIALPVTICDGVWLGANVTILPGVTIGTGALIATGAVVTRDCDPNTLYAGVPAKRIRVLEPIADS